MVREWLQACDAGHDQPIPYECLRQTKSSLPSRILDVCSIPGSESIRLVDGGEDLVGLRYVSLSYCWGKGPHLHSTTSINLEEYKKSIGLSILPQTIKDAVWVARKLSIRFLWVDSLCIVQDSPAEKNHEISKMDRVYGDAYLTIIAANARNCHEGFLNRRGTLQNTIRMPFRCTSGVCGFVSIEFRAGRPEYSYDYSTRAGLERTVEPLDERAWALQERFMSSRILLFSSRQLFWICKAAFGRDGGTMSRDDYFPKAAWRKATLAPTRSWATPADARSQSAWENIVEDYSERKLTDPRDKLLAISSIATLWSRASNEGYVAGLWKGNEFVPGPLISRDKLLRGLCWKTRQPWSSKLRDIYLAPSWSMMSVNLPVNFENLDESCTPPVQYLVSLVDCYVTLEDPDLPFGRVRGGVLKLRGSLFRASTARLGKEVDGKFMLLNYPIFKSPPRNVNFDIPRFLRLQYDVMMKDDEITVTTNHGQMPFESQVWCLPLRSANILWGLVLSQLPNGQFHRIGCFYSDDRSHIRASHLSEPEIIEIV
jgi:hypothetical protein